MNRAVHVTCVGQYIQGDFDLLRPSSSPSPSPHSLLPPPPPLQAGFPFPLKMLGMMYIMSYDLVEQIGGKQYKVQGGGQIGGRLYGAGEGRNDTAAPSSVLHSSMALSFPLPASSFSDAASARRSPKCDLVHAGHPSVTLCTPICAGSAGAGGGAPAGEGV